MHSAQVPFSPQLQTGDLALADCHRHIAAAVGPAPGPLADPDAALRTWNPQGSVEFGETRAHTLYWLLSLKEMGRPDGTVTADTPLYAVFRDATGRRTYLAYNARRAPLHVTFSTGRTLDVPAHSLARAH